MALNRPGAKLGFQLMHGGFLVGSSWRITLLTYGDLWRIFNISYTQARAGLKKSEAGEGRKGWDGFVLRWHLTAGAVVIALGEDDPGRDGRRIYLLTDDMNSLISIYAYSAGHSFWFKEKISKTAKTVLTPGIRLPSLGDTLHRAW